MQSKKKNHTEEKRNLHPRNSHRFSYDFDALIATNPALAPYVKPNKYTNLSIDFFDPEAVKMLNKTLLKHFYGIDYWDIPKGYLCPPIPGRVDYIHYLADLLQTSFAIKLEDLKSGISCLDIGVGANCIYPIIGNRVYSWKFVGSDIDAISLKSASKIIESNNFLKSEISLRLQVNKSNFFKGIIEKNEFYDLSICNPPFHASASEANAASTRKLNNLKSKNSTHLLNFGGQTNELWTEGGETKFIGSLIYESKHFASSCFWFTTLVSKDSSLKSIYQTLKKVGALEVKTIGMSQGNKVSRIVAWSFLTEEQKNSWVSNKKESIKIG
jgi:23S rRNA (adenine1618-N6)-methyltransferase